MSAPLWLLGLELVFILGLGTAAWLLGLWRGRQRRAAELESLLDNLETAAPKRCERYCQWLRAHCGVDEEQALLTANAWLEAERRFWRHFINWRLESDPAGLARLPAHLHRYLDDRLEALGPLLRPSEPALEPEKASEENGQATAAPQPVEPEIGDERDHAEPDTPPFDSEIVILSDRRGEAGKSNDAGDREMPGASETEPQSPEAPQ